METVNFILSGLGGQGILFLTKVLAQCALDRGVPVLGAETHGMAQRGGSVVSHLKIGNVESSLVREGTAHFLLSLEENEAYRGIPFLAKHGKLYVNASGDSFPKETVRLFFEKMNIAFHALPVGKIAFELGAPLAANSGLLGLFAAFDDIPFAQEEIRENIERFSPKPFRSLNVTVFDSCRQKAISSGLTTDRL